MPPQKYVKKIWTIRLGPSGYYMIGPTGHLVGHLVEGKKISDLVDMARQANADEIVHDYDCSKPE